MNLYRLLAAALLVSGCASPPSDVQSDAAKVESEKNGCMEVTGSRIPRCDRDGMSATTQVDAKRMDRDDLRATMLPGASIGK